MYPFVHRSECDSPNIKIRTVAVKTFLPLLAVRAEIVTRKVQIIRPDHADGRVPLGYKKGRHFLVEYYVGTKKRNRR